MKTLTIKIVSDGTLWGTKVVDDTGTIVPVLGASWHLEVGPDGVLTGHSIAQVTLLDVPLEYTGPADVTMVNALGTQE